MRALQLSFLVDPAAPGERALELEIPAGVSHLAVDRDAGPVIRRERHGAAAVLETIRLNGREQLLLLARSEQRLRLNGYPAPRVAVLRLKDQLQLGDRVLHVTMYQRPRLITPPSEQVGRPCPVCKVPFAVDTRVFVCPHPPRLDAKLPRSARLNDMTGNSYTLKARYVFPVDVPPTADGTVNSEPPCDPAT